MYLYRSQERNKKKLSSLVDGDELVFTNFSTVFIHLDHSRLFFK